MTAATLSGRDLPSLSKSIEKTIEYRFLADLTTELLLRGLDFDVLRGEVDQHGYDIVVEVAGIVRHIQLKSTIKGGRRATISVNMKLAAKPSGCVIWTTFDPETCSLIKYRWFGAEPGKPLPVPEDAVVAKHTRRNSDGIKAVRPNHRVVGRNLIKDQPGGVVVIADLLFGPVGGATSNGSK